MSKKVFFGNKRHGLSLKVVKHRGGLITLLGFVVNLSKVKGRKDFN